MDDRSGVGHTVGFRGESETGPVLGLEFAIKHRVAGFGCGSDIRVMREPHVMRELRSDRAKSGI